MFEVDDFIDRIAKPLYTFRMARGRLASLTGNDASAGIRQSAETHMTNATESIEQAVLAYAEVIKKRREGNE